MTSRRSFVATLLGLIGAVKAGLGFAPSIEVRPIVAPLPLVGPKTVFIAVEAEEWTTTIAGRRVRKDLNEAAVLAAVARQFPGMTVLRNDWGVDSSFWPIFTSGGMSAEMRGILLYRDTPEDLIGTEPAEECWILDNTGFRQRQRHVDINQRNWGGHSRKDSSLRLFDGRGRNFHY